MKNETSWKKGQSGNLSGRPRKGLSFAENLRKMMAQKDPKTKKRYMDELIMSLISEAIDGNMKAMDLILKYTDGLPVQQIQQQTDLNAKLEIIFTDDKEDK